MLKGGTAIKRCYFGDYRFSEDLDFTLATESTSDEIRRELDPRLVFPLEDRPVLRGYEEYADLPDDAKIRVYSLGEIMAERVVALTDRARNEPRDLYDAWRLVNEGHVDLADVVDAIEQKWDFRGKNLADVRGEFAAKEPRYKKLWGLRLSGQMVDLPEFNEVYRTVRRAFRQAGLTGK